MARYCTLAFALPAQDGGTVVPSSAARPRNPVTTSSRPTITKAAQAQARETSTRLKFAFAYAAICAGSPCEYTPIGPDHALIYKG